MLTWPRFCAAPLPFQSPSCSGPRHCAFLPLTLPPNANPNRGASLLPPCLPCAPLQAPASLPSGPVGGVPRPVPSSCAPDPVPLVPLETCSSSGACPSCSFSLSSLARFSLGRNIPRTLLSERSLASTLPGALCHPAVLTSLLLPLPHCRALLRCSRPVPTPGTRAWSCPPVALHVARANGHFLVLFGNM